MNKKPLYFLVLILVAVDILIWIFVFSPSKSGTNPEIYFFDVGQGDSQLVNLPSKKNETIQILIDGGPDRSVLGELSGVLKTGDKYIDVVMGTHPQTDHIGGLIDVLDNYEVGLLVLNGRQGNSEAYESLVKFSETKKIPTISLGEGDFIIFEDYKFEFLSPSDDLLLNTEINETSLVFLFDNNKTNFRALFTGDAGFEVEKYITEKYDVSASVLKVGHHGSKNASGENFLSKVNPKVSIIGVGENSYGHPTKEALGRLRAVGSNIYTTQEFGTVRLVFGDGGISVQTSR